MFALIRYHVSYYIKSSKFVMPLLIYFVFLTLLYSQGSATVSKMLLSASALYLIQVWTGFVYSSVENPVSEQVIMLKSGNLKAFYRSKIVFLFIFSGFMSVVGILLPIIRDIIGKVSSGSGASMSVMLGIQFLFIHLTCSFLGAMVGYFFQPRVFHNKKLIIILSIIFAIMGFVKGPLVQDMPGMMAVTWVFPPMYSVVTLEPLKSSGLFPAGDFILVVGVSFLYSIILAVLNIFLLRKKGF